MRTTIAAALLLVGLGACDRDVYLGDSRVSDDAGAADAAPPGVIVAGDYHLDYPEQLALVCDEGLSSLAAALADQDAAALSLASGPVQLATPSKFLVIGGAPILTGFGVESLVLSQDTAGLPRDLFAAELMVNGAAPGGAERRWALVALDPALASGREIGGRAAVAVGMQGFAARCTITFRARLCRDPAIGPCS